MKKILLLTKSFVILSLLFCSIGVFADIPRTINVQGKVTNDSGGPILNPENVEVKLYVSDDRNTYEFKPIQEDLPVKIDSEGLYNVNMDLGDMKFNIDNEYTFEVEVTADGTSIRSKARPFASNPFAFYASTSTYSSTATYSLMLDPLKGEKLKNENFYTSSHTYTIKVGTAAYAINASSITRKGSKGQVWGMDTTNTQGWINPGDIAISTAAANKLGGIMLGTDTGLYIPTNSAILMLKAATASTIGGVIVSTGTGTGLTITDGVLGISPASADGFGVVKVNSGNGLNNNSGTISISTDTEPTQNSNKLLTSGVIYSTMTSIYSDLAGKISGITLGEGNGIDIDATTKDISAVGDSSKGIEVGSAGIGITLATNSGLEFNSGLKVSTDTEPTQNSNKLLTSGVIYSTMTNIYNDLAGKISGITLGEGDGIDIDQNTKTISVARAHNGGVDVVSGGLAVSVDNETIQIVSNSTGTLTVAALPKRSLQGNPKNKVWGYATDELTSQGWISITDISGTSVEEGLSYNNDILKVSTATGTGLIFSDNTADAVLKISTGTGLDIDENNNVIVTAATAGNIGGFKLIGENDHDSGLTMDDDILKINVGTGLAIDDDNKVIVSTGAGLAFDANNGIVVSTGTGLTIDTNNKINVVAATDEIIGGFKLTGSDAHDSGLAMGEDAILKVSTGTGLDIDTNNKVVVTTAPAAERIINSSTMTVAYSNNYNSEYFYVWTAKSKGSNHDLDSDNQGWLRMKVDKWGSGSYFYTGADLAEIYQSTEKLVPGDVVSIDPSKDNAIVKTKVAEDTMVAGVISTEPGVLMNQDEKGYKLALVGKVPTKVCNEGGAIKRGDLLVSASIPGYAKKAGDNPKVGTVIGKALENSDSQKGTILVLVNLQ